jgi:hypothetical protein
MTTAKGGGFLSFNKILRAPDVAVYNRAFHTASKKAVYFITGKNKNRALSAKLDKL